MFDQITLRNYLLYEERGEKEMNKEKTTSDSRDKK
jgi:hypothetical protein